MRKELVVAAEGESGVAWDWTGAKRNTGRKEEGCNRLTDTDWSNSRGKYIVL